MHIALCHPGKIGDMLYVLPTARKIYETTGADIDIITSELCKPAEQLVRYQPYIHDFIIPSNYILNNVGQGCQPWYMDPGPGYDKVYQLGYEHFPDGPLHNFTARRAGVYPVDSPRYDYPDKLFSEDPYIVVAHCSSRAYPELTEEYRKFISNCPIKVIQTGVPEDWVEAPSINMTGINLLEVLPLIAHAKAYIGFYSGLLVLANGFSIPKIITMWPGVGESHGLHIDPTVDLPFATAGSILQTLQQYL